MTKFITMLLMVTMLSGCAAHAADKQKLPVTRKGKPVATFNVEVVANDEDRARGLMHRKELPVGHGMLFVFPMVGENAFWMKNTLIPLDMIFINPDGSIRSIHPMAEPESRKIIKSGGPVKAGLEINGGEAKKKGLKVGDIVHFKTFGNQLDKP